MAQHRHDINKNVKDRPVASHFNNAGHTIKDMTLIIARHNHNWDNTTRKQTERAFIEIFESQFPSGMNLNE
jgi:hypothetical protein